MSKCNLHVRKLSKIFRFAKTKSYNSDGKYLSNNISQCKKVTNPDDLPIKPSKSGNHYDGMFHFKFHF